MSTEIEKDFQGEWQVHTNQNPTTIKFQLKSYKHTTSQEQ